jgi:hypothetical protein
VYVTFTEPSDVPVENQTKLVEKAEDIEVVNPSAMDRAVVASVLLNKYTRNDWSVENVTAIVVTSIKVESLKSTPLGKCTKEALLEVTVLTVPTELAVQLTTTITFSESCGNPSVAFTCGTRAGLIPIARKQIMIEQNSKSCFIMYRNLCYFLFYNKTLH